MNIAYALWSVYLFLALGITADGFFVPTLTRIADNWSLSDNVAGVTLVALGNGSPDIFSAVAAFTAADPSVATMAIGSLLGAGMFVVMVVGGACMIVRPFELDKWSTLRNVCHIPDSRPGQSSMDRLTSEKFSDSILFCFNLKMAKIPK